MEKNLQHYIKTYKLVDEEICNQTVKDIEKLHWAQHTFYNPIDNSISPRSGEKELDFGFSEAATKNLIMENIWCAFFKYIEELNFPWFIGWQRHTEVRFNRYKETRLMAEHCDHIHSMFDGEIKGVPTMTALGLLNDDFRGGELVFFGDTIIPFKSGEILVFPSCFLFPHRVDPVVEGIRYSFVSWAC
jgi:hypothetical protein